MYRRLSLLVLLCLLLVACGGRGGSPTPTVGSSPDPTSSAGPQASPAPSPTAAASVGQPSPTPTEVASPEPSPTARPSESPAPSPTPTAVASPKPSPTSVPSPTPTRPPGDEQAGCQPARARALYVTSDSGLNLRAEPSTEADILLTMPLGAQVRAICQISVDGESWYKVRYEGHLGYAYANLLTDEEPQPPKPAPTIHVPRGRAASWMDNTILLGMYGRSFGVAPILGRVGLYRNLDDMARDVQRFEAQMRPYIGDKQVRPEIHLIYAMAVPCWGDSDCLSYLDDTGVDIVNTYIKPAQELGWLVVLDTQLGSSNPVEQVQRMIDKGYLKYDNVQVALDPEFHVVPGHDRPGIPVGSIDGSQVNAVQQMLNDYVRREGLPHKKVLIVHQFLESMIQNKDTIRLYPEVDLIIDADGLGAPYIKTFKYNLFTDSSRYPFVRYRGIKLFPEGPSTTEGHFDTPLMTMRQVFGYAPVPGGIRMHVPPDLLIFA
ncbi:SH3 type 3 domain protein [Thermobaculum terrenum ATCC BAA-798]|uniref:SH3 type 3 domain protein n=1 Tax=Thermobaculum terrenum (strain ATCC BAA-798 / CCMEE 7001 / YNP1) TaxID=525904 RepID=D1CD22_THET1|nr:SH3 domain-containing protein [Thermobaculum terrenum]ACZ42687.1 SH3 type 3 domain protein [Thermobaculum terrenum ATCC BAA-798]